MKKETYLVFGRHPNKPQVALPALVMNFTRGFMWLKKIAATDTQNEWFLVEATFDDSSPETEQIQFGENAGNLKIVAKSDIGGLVHYCSEAV